MIKEPKVKEFEAAVAYGTDRHLKIIVRDMALREPTTADGAWYARDIEAYIDNLVELEGWNVKESHILGRKTASALGGDVTEEVLEMVFILTK